MVGGTDTDPKVQVILHYLGERNWLERDGAIIFSQYRTTAEWVLEALCATYPDEPVALYADGVASFVQRGTDRRSAKREHIKESIQRGDVRLVCATDAACEGLNLQRLGAQINADLPWNPSRLEQRKGRVLRIGQVRDDVHILEPATAPAACIDGRVSLRTNADDRLPRDPLGRVESGDGIVEGRYFADVRPQPSVTHPPDDLTQLGAIGHDNEVDRQAVGEPCLGRPGDRHQRSSGSNQACGPLRDFAA